MRCGSWSAASCRWASDDGPEPRELPPVTAPGYVGELGLLRGIPRTATVRTAQESTLLRIDGQDFLSAVQANLPSPSLLAVAGTRMARSPDRARRARTSPPAVPPDHSSSQDRAS